jgi:thymidylate synthase (FAD)
MKRHPQILVELQDWMGDDAAIANAAWTSTYDKSRREERYDDPAKVRDIIENKLFGQEDVHNVPIESVIFRFWIRMPIFSDRQHMTHRIQSANGLSGRY